MRHGPQDQGWVLLQTTRRRLAYAQACMGDMAQRYNVILKHPANGGSKGEIGSTEVHDYDIKMPTLALKSADSDWPHSSKTS